MVDDQNQRPFRSGNTPGRVGPSGNDPLAELARLIGQNDPFGEFGRANARAGNPPAQPQQPGQRPPPQAYTRPEAAQPPQRPQPSYPPQQQFQPHQTFEAPDYGRQNYASPPLAGGDDLYHTGAPAGGYPDAQPGDAYDPYDPNRPPLGVDDQDYYDEPPPRRRMGVMAIAAIFALAVIGTAGAFGYRALFGTTSSGPPPLIKADARPSKVVPEAKDSASKQIVDRVAGGGQGEKLVSREEHPVEIKPVGVFPPQGSPAAGTVQPQGNGTGAMTGEPKKIRTIVIRPDQQSTGSAATQVAAPLPESQGPAPSSTPVNIAPVRQASPPPEQVASAAGPEPMSAPRQTTAHSAPPRPSNAPLSLSPNAEPAAPAPAPRVASAPPQAAPQASGGSGYAVQLSSRRSEGEAQAAFRALQSKFPGQLGSREPLIRRVDLGEKGIYFRAMVGPFGNSDEANRLCSSLKSAGGSCFVQRI